MKFKVWDKLNGEEEDAEIYEAHSPTYAAEMYAESDFDGLCDGLYFEDSQPIMVMAMESFDEYEEGTKWEIDVMAESEPVFYANISNEIAPSKNRLNNIVENIVEDIEHLQYKESERIIKILEDAELQQREVRITWHPDVESCQLKYSCPDAEQWNILEGIPKNLDYHVKQHWQLKNSNHLFGWSFIVGKSKGCLPGIIEVEAL